MVRPIDGSNQSFNSSMNELVNESNNQAINQSIKQPVHQPLNESPLSEQASPSSSSTPRIAEHVIEGQARAAQLRTQLQTRTPVGQVADGPPQGMPPSPARSLQTVMTDAGMRNVSNPPTDQQLTQYHSNHGPAHDQIAAGHYSDAATEYRRLAGAATDPGERQRLQQTATQLDVAQRMRDAGVRNMIFPPSEANVQSYFGTMRGHPIGEVQSAFQNYASAFYVHSETRGVDRGDIHYDVEHHNVGNTRWETYAPEDWADVNGSREMHTDGRRIIDCEGYAYLGQRALSAAGFSQGRYACAMRNDNPNTPNNESFDQHMMFTARRTITDPEGNRHTEVVVISNDRLYNQTTPPNPNAQEVDQAELGAIRRAYGSTFRTGNVIPGGTITLEDTAWRASVELDRLLSQQQQQ